MCSGRAFSFDEKVRRKAGGRQAFVSPTRWCNTQAPRQALSKFLKDCWHGCDPGFCGLSSAKFYRCNFTTAIDTNCVAV